MRLSFFGNEMQTLSYARKDDFLSELEDVSDMVEKPHRCEFVDPASGSQSPQRTRSRELLPTPEGPDASSSLCILNSFSGEHSYPQVDIGIEAVLINVRMEGV